MVDMIGDDIYEESCKHRILELLDGWKALDELEELPEDIEPFIEDVDKYKDNPNKVVPVKEIKQFFYMAYTHSLTYTNRLNVDDLSTVELEYYKRGVCYWAASDLWNKYNIRVNNEDMEDTYIQSYGGLLYKKGENILKPFINQRITSLNSLKKAKSKNRRLW